MSPKIENYWNLKLKYKKEREVPFLVECIDDKDQFIDGFEMKVTKKHFINLGDIYTVDQVVYNQRGEELFRINNGFYSIERFKFVE